MYVAREEFVFDAGVTRLRNAKPVKYIVTDDGCWDCVSHVGNRSKGQGGYSSLSIKVGDNRYKRFYIHRLAYEKEFGRIPAGKIVLHSCDNPRCINPGHMSVGTTSDNVADKVMKGRQQRGEGHGNAKITEDIVRAIRLDSRTNEEIGKEYGIAGSNVSYIKTRKTWKHVD